MTTLTLRAPRTPLKLTFAGLRRVLAVFGAFLDAVADAQQMAADAQRRYPFVR